MMLALPVLVIGNSNEMRLKIRNKYSKTELLFNCQKSMTPLRNREKIAGLAIGVLAPRA